jgi:hypothetical protein
MKAAEVAIAYERPKLAVVANVSETDLAVRLMQAIEASRKVREVQVIEHEPVKQQVQEPLDHSGPFARFRRF